MKSIRFKFIYLVVSTLILLSLALPVFSFKIGGKEFKYPSIGFSKIGIPSDFPDFKKGSDLYLSYRYVGKLDFSAMELESIRKDEELEKVTDKVRTRAKYANLNDIKIFSQNIGDEYFVVLDIPQNYLNPGDYASWLTTSGGMNINAIDFNSGAEVIISDKEIDQIYKAGGFQIPIGNGQAQNYNIDNLLIVVNENLDDKVLELKNLIRSAAAQSSESTTQSYIATLNIDNFALQLLPDDKKPNWLRAIPDFSSVEETNSKYESDFLSVMQALFQEESILDFPITLNEGREEISTIYNSNGGSRTALGFVVGTILVLIALIASKLLSRKKILPFGLILTNTTLLTVVFLKLVQAYLSTGLIIGFIITTIIYILFSYEIARIEENEGVTKRLTNIRILSVISLIWLLVIYKLELSLGQYNDALSVFTLASIVIFVQTFVYANIVLQIFTNSKFSFKKLLSLKSKRYVK
jgi:hypothetical protein